MKIECVKERKWKYFPSVYHPILFCRRKTKKITINRSLSWNSKSKSFVVDSFLFSSFLLCSHIFHYPVSLSPLLRNNNMKYSQIKWGGRERGRGEAWLRLRQLFARNSGRFSYVTRVGKISRSYIRSPACVYDNTQCFVRPISLSLSGCVGKKSKKKNTFFRHNLQMIHLTT